MQFHEPATPGARLKAMWASRGPASRGNDRVGVAGEPPLVFAHEEQVDVGEDLPPCRERAVTDEFERIQ